MYVLKLGGGIGSLGRAIAAGSYSPRSQLASSFNDSVSYTFLISIDTNNPNYMKKLVLIIYIFWIYMNMFIVVTVPQARSIAHLVETVHTASLLR